MRDLGKGILMFAALSVSTGLVYPLVVTGLSRMLFPGQAGGSLVFSGDKVVGSRLVGQSFTSPRYFHGRPSALEKPYDAGTSGGSNSGPTNGKYLGEVDRRVRRTRDENNAPAGSVVPADLVLASGSGLDPDISLEAALFQAARVAKARGMEEADVRDLAARAAKGRYPGRMRVNVLELNMALDGVSQK